MLKGAQREKVKNLAITLRKKGYSYPMIEKELGTPRATLNGWFKDVQLSKRAQNIILDRKRSNLKKLREKALVVLRGRILRHKSELYEVVRKEYEDYNFDFKIKELLLAMLYLGEGFKKTRSHIGLGNSSSKIMCLFVGFLRDIYHVDNSKLRCFLHLRMDQNSEIEKKYWSKHMNIPEIYFRKPQFDKRAKTKTFPEYHGVCVIYCYDAKVEKRLTAMQQILFEKSLGV